MIKIDDISVSLKGVILTYSNYKENRINEILFTLQNPSIFNIICILSDNVFVPGKHLNSSIKFDLSGEYRVNSFVLAELEVNFVCPLVANSIHIL